MTEQEWLECSDSQQMLDFLLGKASERKRRLFAVACARAVWPRLADQDKWRAVEMAERFADGTASADALKAALAPLWEPWRGRPAGPARPSTPEAIEAWSVAAATALRATVESRTWHIATRLTGPHQPALLRCIFGNPFRPAVVDPAWLSWNGGTVARLAQAAYDERILPAGTLDPARLAVLADALEEAGCTDANILGHLRGPGPHVRGCWVVDLLLGKE